MPIILARIDDRLVHGQVVEGWGNILKPDNILVVSNEVASSKWHSDLCLASLPANFNGMVSSVEDAPHIINKLNDDSHNSYVLFESPGDVYKVVKNGARLTEINVGGMHSSKNKRELLEYIYIDDTDVMNLRALCDLGIKLDFRDLPGHEKLDVMSLL